MKQNLFFIAIERCNEHLNLTLQSLTISKLVLNFLEVNREFLEVGILMLLWVPVSNTTCSTDLVVQETKQFKYQRGTLSEKTLLSLQYKIILVIILSQLFQQIPKSTDMLEITFIPSVCFEECVQVDSNREAKRNQRQLQKKGTFNLFHYSMVLAAHCFSKPSSITLFFLHISY